MIEQYIPLLNIGPGTQPEDEDVLEYISMPQGMATHVAPQLPEPEEIARHPGARRVLQELLDLLRQCGDGRTPRGLDLRELSAAERALLDQLLGEGEVSVRVGEGAAALRVQESIFAGVWRLVGPDCDRLEVGAAPALLRPAALAASHADQLEASRPVPAGVMNAPAILTELADRCRSWQPGQPAHVINLTLLPLSPDDVAFLDACLGAGPVLALARGYGNCRLQSTLAPHCWRVSYFNSQDALILDTIEVTDLPEVIGAAPEDLADSLERFADVIQWFEGQ